MRPPGRSELRILKHNYEYCEWGILNEKYFTSKK